MGAPRTIHANIARIMKLFAALLPKPIDSVSDAGG
jgi:hypothetical protein